MNCYKCKHANLHGSNFCEKCGSDLKAPPPPQVVPVRPYGGYNPPPASYSPPSHRNPAPRPTPAPRPSPAGSGYSPPTPAQPEPALPPVSAPPKPSAAKTPPKRRRNPMISQPVEQQSAERPATPRREPLPFGRLTGAAGIDFPLRYDVNLIGRASPGEGIVPQVDLSQADTSGTVSRKHARIGKDDSSVFLEDLGSSNGTRHNGQPLRAGMQTPLNDGDQIIFGDVVFSFHLISS
jgi:FHA domain